MSFSLCEHQLCTTVDEFVVWTVPGDNHSIDAAAYQVLHLPMDLVRAVGTIAQVMMLRRTPPPQVMRENLRSRSRVEKRAYRQLAYVPQLIRVTIHSPYCTSVV